MQFARILATAVVIVVTSVLSAFGQFWYGVHGPVRLEIDSSKVTIKFDAGFSSMEQVMLLPSVEGMAQ